LISLAVSYPEFRSAVAPFSTAFQDYWQKFRLLQLVYIRFDSFCQLVCHPQVLSKPLFFRKDIFGLTNFLQSINDLNLTFRSFPRQSCDRNACFTGMTDLMKSSLIGSVVMINNSHRLKTIDQNYSSVQKHFSIQNVNHKRTNK
jgi:hypothetical protein